MHRIFKAAKKIMFNKKCFLFNNKFRIFKLIFAQQYQNLAT